MGIYWIVSNTTGKIYIGSSVAVGKRWNHHRCRLRGSTHHNHRLQAAFDRGETFQWLMVEDLTTHNLDWECLLLIEQWYILHYRPALNLCRDVFGDLSRHNARQWIVCGPDGVEHKIRNLEGYCRDRGIESQNLRKVAKGVIGQHKGYRCRFPSDEQYRFRPKVRRPCNVGLQNVRQWLITHPDGRTEEVRGLIAFCRAHDLDPSGFSRAADGNRPYRGYGIVRLGARRTYSTRPNPADALPIP